MPSVDGIVSGLNTTAIIDAIVNAQSIPKTLLESQVTYDKDRLDKLAGVKNRLTTLSSKLQAINTAGEFGVLSAKTSDSDTQFKASITDNSKAIAGSYAVRVTGLAKNEIENSQNFNTKTTLDTVQRGTYQINYGGAITSFDIDGTNSSLDGFVSKFNSTVTGAKAYVVDNGDSVSGNRYSIMIQGDDTGVAKSISMSVSGTSGPGAAITWTQKQAAADATATVAGITVQSATNVIKDVLPGVQLDLKSVGASDVTLTIDRDSSAIQSKIQDFVNAYNDTISYYRTNSLYDEDKGIKGALFGEPTSRRVIQELGDIISEDYTTSGAFKAFSEIGIKTNTDGSLSLDTSKLSSVLSSNYSDVEALFTSTGGPAETLRARIDDTYVHTTNGTLVTASSSLESRITDNEERIERMQASLDDYAARLREQFNAMEQILGDLRATGSFLSQSLGTTSTS